MGKPKLDAPTTVATSPLDAYSPAAIARLVETVGVKKANAGG